MKTQKDVIKPAYKRTEVICEQIKQWIVERQLKPGDRLPQERELIEQFKASKSTVREALSALQSQGLVNTRTGPGGGAFIAPLDTKRAMELLSNHFYFRQPTIDDIYELRKMLEPELAVSLAGNLKQADFDRLHATISLYDHPASNLGEEYTQRIAELNFHSLLADLCPNPLLGFICGFLQKLLKDLAICRRIYDEPNPQLREAGLHYQVELLKALKLGDADAARNIMYQHMCAAHRYMKECEVELSSGFISRSGQGD